MKEWNGEERRKQIRLATEDHDILIEIKALVSTLSVDYKEHKEDDKKNFVALNRFMYGVVGAFVLFKIFIGVFK